MAGKAESWLRGMIEGPQGEVSSKRISGLTMIALGSLLLVILGGASFFVIPPGSDIVLKSGISLIASGAALLGIGTLAERLGK